VNLLKPAWMQYAWGEIGTGEFAGSADNPRIVQYHWAVGAGSSGDEVAWCSSLVNWVFKQVGVERTRSRAARSWEKWGQELEEPVYGCVCILWRESRQSWKGHVGFWIAEDSHRVLLLGGNQGNEVCARWFPKGRVLSYRMPA